MTEWIIEVMNGAIVVALVHTERDGRLTQVKPTPEGYAHVKKYRVKARAEGVAAKVANARVAATYGGHVYGTKRSVAPVQSKINRTTPYRSI